MGHLLSDLRFGARLLVKRPGLAALAVVALSLGIGLTTTMFSIVNGAVLRGLPFEEPRRLLHIERNNLTEGIQSMEVPIHDYVDWRAQQRSFEDIAAFYTGTVNLSGEAPQPERFSGAFITPNALRLLRARPLLGRTFAEDEAVLGAPGVVVLAYNLWQNRFGGDPAIIRKTIRANAQTVTVIGVMPRGFMFPVRQEAWLPLRIDAVATPRGRGPTLEVFGRLNDGITMDQAAAEFAGMARRLGLEHPRENHNVGSVIKPYTREFIGEEPVRLLYTMLGAVFAVLLIACSNVANLLLARATLRTREVAIRTALGASRARVVMQLLAEAFVLAVAGALVGLVIASVALRWFNNAIALTNPPFWIDIKIDSTVLLFVTAVTALSSLVAGILPALQASGKNVNEVLKDESRGSSSLRMGRLSRGLVVAEIALSCGLLVAAGLMVKSVVTLRTFDFGVATTDVFTARIGLFEGAYPDSTTRQRFWDELVRRLETKPGARAVALTTSLPTQGTSRVPVALEDASYATDRDYPTARMAAVTPEFFETFGVSVLQGRGIATSDVASSLPVAIVNQGFADRFSPGESPIGKRIRAGRSDSREAWRTIVGVVPDMWMGSPDDDDQLGFYVPLAQSDISFMSVAIRAEGNPMALAPLVQGEVAALDPDLPIYFVRTMREAIRQNTWFYGVFGTLFMVFGFAALFLASVGLYGVMAFSVSRRTAEIGVRMALGAGANAVLRLFLTQGAVQIAVGIVVGLGLGMLLSRGLRVILFRVEPADPTMFGAIALVLAATSLLACYLPARRATRVDPVVALRYE